MQYFLILGIAFATVVFFTAGAYHLAVSCYFLFNRDKMSDGENLKAYVKHKYYVRFSRFGLIASALGTIATLIQGQYRLLGFSIVWTTIFLALWIFFGRVLRNKEQELERVKNITNQR